MSFAVVFTLVTMYCGILHQKVSDGSTEHTIYDATNPAVRPAVMKPAYPAGLDFLSVVQ